MEKKKQWRADQAHKLYHWKSTPLNQKEKDRWIKKQLIAHHSLSDTVSTLSFLDMLSAEIEGAMELSISDPYLNMATHLIKNHLEAKPVTKSSLLASSNVPYATATRRFDEMINAGLITQRTRTKTGKSFSLHPSEKLLESWMRLSNRVHRVAIQSFDFHKDQNADSDYYYGNSYLKAQSIKPPQVLAEPLKLSGGIRVLVHGDPTFMVMNNIKRQLELIIGSKLTQRAFSIDRLHNEILRNAERPNSQYDIIAVNLPWVGELVDKNILTALDEIIDIERLDPSDFHATGWQAAHWNGHPYGVPTQTTPELLFYRQDLFEKAGLKPPVNTDEVLKAAKIFHQPSKGFYGLAWNVARGTALGHTCLTTFACFGQPIFNLKKISGGFDVSHLSNQNLQVTIDTEIGLEAAEYLMELLQYSPPNILSMSWYERLRPYAEGKVAMAYCYTSLAPYFELDASSPAFEQTGYLPQPSGAHGHPIAPIGGYILSIPNNLSAKRKEAISEALIAFTSAEVQKLLILNGSRTAPRYSVAADPEVREISPIFEAVDAMSWRDELQFWPRPPVPYISQIIQVCGETFHDMLRGILTPKEALRKAQGQADKIVKQISKN